MKRVKLLFLLYCFAILIFENSCRKENYGAPFLGMIIGFDQCSGNPADSAARGYVIKIEQIKNDADTLIIDTAMTYSLPNRFTFHPRMFAHYQDSYLFPIEDRTDYQFWFSYKKTPLMKRVTPACTADILLYPIEGPDSKQILITHIYQIIRNGSHK